MLFQVYDSIPELSVQIPIVAIYLVLIISFAYDFVKNLNAYCKKKEHTVKGLMGGVWGVVGVGGVVLAVGGVGGMRAGGGGRWEAWEWWGGVVGGMGGG